MKMFKKKEVPEKRQVVKMHVSYHMTYERVDHELCEALKSADLMSDAQEVIECLRESPRFKRHLCRVAEQKLEAKRKELEEAEKAVRTFCHIGEA